MRLELIRVGLLVELANHYTTRGASESDTENETTGFPIFIVIGSLNEICQTKISPFLGLVSLFEFYGISTLVGHLTQNSVYIHTCSTKDFKTNNKVGKIFN